MGATVAWGGTLSAPPRNWHERRDLFAEGVASGDPEPNSVLLWTRRSPDVEPVGSLQVQVAEDVSFHRIIATAEAPISAAADWTTRVLVGSLKPATVYWYRFVDSHGNGSRVGRTITAPAEDDARQVRFAFVSCQNANQGAQNAYRRMIYEDERAPADQQLGFVLHLGDFIYEIVWYPEDRPQGMYDRRLRDIVRYQHGEKIRDFHIPTTIDDYRAIYRAYLHDPDLQDARARWPFVDMWDNHEYSWLGWQSLQKFEGKTRAGANAEGRRQSGILRVSRSTHGASGQHVARSISIPRTSSTRRSHISISTGSARSRTIFSPSTASRDIAQCAGVETSS